jgi:hypothetical protein
VGGRSEKVNYISMMMDMAEDFSEHDPGELLAECIGDLLYVLCAAKDETSVEFMGRMFCCNFLRKSRLSQIWLAGRLTPDVATMYER